MVFPQLHKTLSIKRWPASFDQYVKPFPEAIVMLRVWLTLASLPKCDSALVISLHHCSLLWKSELNSDFLDLPAVCALFSGG